jgi:N-acetylglucosamine kinase-like BadF-type ATPase
MKRIEGMTSNMVITLGIDAGGTSTRAALAVLEPNEQDGRIVARASGGSIKVMRVTPAQAEAHLRDILGQLVAHSALGLEQITAACVGIAGNNVASVNRWVRQTLGPMLHGDLDVCCDTDIALDAAFPGEAGVLVIAGTGANILGRARSGAQVYVGGWGPMLADEGSGYWIGLQALRAALRAYDRGASPRVLDAITAQWKIDTLDQLVEMAHAQPPPDFAALTRVVVQEAGAGDELAQSVLRAAGKTLAADAALALDKLRAVDGDAPMRLAFTGSVLEHIALVRTTMLEELERLRPGVDVLPHAVDPVEGALWRARRLAGDLP